MSIKAKAYIAFAISIVLISISGFFVFSATHNLKKAIEESRVAHEILKGVFDLNVLTNDYLLHREERARIQWQSRYDSLKTFFMPDDLIIFEEEEKWALMGDLYTDYENIGTIFNELIVEYRKQPFNNEEENNVSEELEERLIQRLLVHSQAIVSNAGKITEQVRKEVVGEQYRARILIVGSLGLIAGVIIIILFWIIRSVVKPIRLLQKGTEAISKGNLDYRINIKTKDEFEYLGSEFNKMTEELKESYEGLERKVRERTAELEETKNRSEVLLASIGDAVFAIDTEQNIIHLNKRAEELSGYKSSEVLGKPYYDVLKFVKEKDRSENIAFIRKALKGEATEMVDETVLVRKNQSELQVEDSAAPVKRDKGEIIGAIIVFRDATKERKIQQMRSEFMSLASHELKAPLTVIRGYLDELTDKTTGPLTKEQRKLIEITMKASDKLLKLANELLNVTRLEEGRVKTEPLVVDPVDLAEKAITDELQQLFKQKKQKFTFEKPESLPEIKIDPKFVMVPIQNLLSNASKYTPEKGTIEFKVSQSDNRIIFQVTDSGLGIPVEEQFKVFQRFFRASNVTHLEKGTGLGLYLTKLMIEMSGGRIWFKSKENKGTTFYFSLPISKR